mgnify:CR=1 FL=1
MLNIAICDDDIQTTGRMDMLLQEIAKRNFMDVEIEVFDMSGRILWRHSESAIPTSSVYTVAWDLCTDGGNKLHTGVYLYRVKIASEGSSKVSKSHKLIVISNN